MAAMTARSLGGEKAIWRRAHQACWGRTLQAEEPARKLWDASARRAYRAGIWPCLEGFCHGRREEQRGRGEAEERPGRHVETLRQRRRRRDGVRRVSARSERGGCLC